MDTSQPAGIFSSRNIILGLLVFNIIGIGLSEMQRRSLVRLSNEHIDLNTKAIAALDQRLSSIQVEQRALWDDIGATPQRRDRKVVASLLNTGQPVAVRFNQTISNLPAWNAQTGCAGNPAGAYLGIFVPGQIYVVSYAPSTQTWTASGPSQQLIYNSNTQTCFSQTAVYGPKELKQVISSESGRVVIWGAVFNLNGNLLEKDGLQVGEVLGLY